MSPWIYDIAVLFSLCIMTLGMLGIVRMPDIYTKLHGAAKAVFLGVVTLGISTMTVTSGQARGRIVVICLLVILCTPISSHVIAHAAFIRHERMQTPGAVDESDTLDLTEQIPSGPVWRI